ncbi:uncharacterized protein A4U43_C02F17100 [Asparagus officinalis]|uniref:Uncharacterized protein n=1 Tax=Asparagus officinalis TaxID=4686 RepID=A0A5P1FJL4_ASPOF|nr:uncharacterized protein A4U43_C02F17100 [Asparagus officinalis]
MLVGRGQIKRALLVQLMMTRTDQEGSSSAAIDDMTNKGTNKDDLDEANNDDFEALSEEEFGVDIRYEKNPKLKNYVNEPMKHFDDLRLNDNLCLVARFVIGTFFHRNIGSM